MSPLLLLLPGWSFDTGTFDPLCASVPGNRSLLPWDLPGHGEAAEPAGARLAGMAAPFLAKAPEEAVWLGWSLGGTVVLEGLRRGARPRGAILLSATPRLTQVDGWPCALPPEELLAMRQGLERSADAVVRRFRRYLGRVSAADAAAFSGGRAATDAGLRVGLTALAEADLRPEVSGAHGSVPTLWLGGGQDPLVPPAAVRQAAEAFGGWCEIVHPAGHAPHWTHPGWVAQVMEQFVEELAR